jgi:hypothetical protein
MPLTNRESIRKIIFAEDVILPNTYNERIVFSETDPIQLSHSSIDEETESVKICQETEPHDDSHSPITLNANVPVSLDYQKIAWDSVVVSSDAAGATIYAENLDYVIDYFSGTILRTNDGSIPDGGTVYVWYLPFTVFTRDIDYSIDYTFGQIRRRASGDIPNGATAFVDYSHSQATLSDDAIDLAIEQSEAFISPRLRSGYSLESAEQGLKSAAEFFVVYNLCLSKAFQELNVSPRDISDDLAKQWQALSDKYLEIAKSYFARYLNVTELPAGGLIKNRFVQNRPNRSSISPPVPKRTRRF